MEVKRLARRGPEENTGFQLQTQDRNEWWNINMNNKEIKTEKVQNN